MDLLISIFVALLILICILPVGIIVQRLNERKRIKRKETNQADAIQRLYPKPKDRTD